MGASSRRGAFRLFDAVKIDVFTGCYKRPKLGSGQIFEDVDFLIDGPSIFKVFGKYQCKEYQYVMFFAR